MKAGIKILLWSLVSGGIGIFAGWTAGGRKIAKIGEELEEARAKVQELTDIAVTLAYAVKKEAPPIKPTVSDITSTYLGKPATDEDPDMPEEKPEIGDEDIVESSPTIEFISEEEYYDNPENYQQEELIWYSLDQVLWNKDTQSKMNRLETDRSLGYNTLNMFEPNLLNQNPPDTLFVKNNILRYMFQVDHIEAAWVDEHKTEEPEDD